MEPTYEKVDDNTFLKITPKREPLNLRDLREKRRNAVDARTRFVAEATAQQAIIDEIDTDIAEARKVGVSTSTEVDQPVIEEGSPAPEGEVEVTPEP